MQNETIEALRSAQELCAYLWNNTDANNPEAANVELIAHSDKHADQLAALLNDARERVGSALHGIELGSEPLFDRGALDAQAAELGRLQAEVLRLRSVIEEALPFQLHVGAQILNQGLEAAPDGVRVVKA